MKTFPLQADFSSGELSPKLFGRTNTERYQSGLAECTNFLPLSQGPVQLRQGGEFQAEAKVADVLLIPFDPDLSDNFIIELGSNYIRFYDDDGPVLSGGSPYEVAKPAGTGSNFTSTTLLVLQWALNTETKELYLFGANKAPSRITYISRTNWTWDLIPFTNAPSSWTGSVWPSMVTIHESRLWVGRTSSAPSTLWASKTNSYFDFDQGTGLADEAMEFTIGERGAIQWLAAPKDLLVGTRTAEYIISSAEGFLAPTTNPQVTPQSRYGSMSLQAVPVGNALLYVSPDRRRLRSAFYQFVEDGWISDNITWPSEHITAGLIREMAYAPLPTPIVWLIDNDGLLISCVYDREQRIVGWATHPTDGETISVASLLTDEGSTLWTAVKRTNGTIVEKVKQSNEIYLDSHITQDLGSPGTAVSGLDHLDGDTVTVIGDGVRLDDEVVASGAITISEAAQIVTVGLSYQGKVVTLPIEGAVQGSSMQAMEKNLNRIILRLDAAVLPFINGYQPVAKTYEEINCKNCNAQDVDVTNLGTDGFGQVEIIQDEPFATTVFGLFSETSVEVFG